MSPTRPTFHLRRASEADTQAVHDCVCAAFIVYIERMGKAPAPMLYDYANVIAEQQTWLAEHNGAVVGVLVLREADGAFILDTIATSLALRGQGVGRALLELAEMQARQQGYSAIELCTNAAMTENQHLYERIGYQHYLSAEQDGYMRIFYRKPLP